MQKLFSLLLIFMLADAASAANDPHSYAEPDRFLVRHVALDLSADFTAHRLEGTAELTVERIDPAARELHLDTRDLEIRSIQLLDAAGQAQNLAFRFDPPDSHVASRLTIDLAPQKDEPKQQRLRIDYRTSTEASALQWLEPAQTFGPHPFMYSQGQAIHTRSWIPIQDTPAVRVRYTARIRTPREHALERLGQIPGRPHREEADLDAEHGGGALDVPYLRPGDGIVRIEHCGPQVDEIQVFLRCDVLLDSPIGHHALWRLVPAARPRSNARIDDSHVR